MLPGTGMVTVVDGDGLGVLVRVGDGLVVRVVVGGVVVVVVVVVVVELVVDDELGGGGGGV